MGVATSPCIQINKMSVCLSVTMDLAIRLIVMALLYKPKEGLQLTCWRVIQTS